MTILQLWETIRTQENDATSICVFDKTGNIDFGTFYKNGKTNLPEYFRYVDIESINPNYHSISIRVKDFRGDLNTRDGHLVYVFGFDYDNGGGDYRAKYSPAYINISDGGTVKKIKLKPCSVYGYEFYYKKKRYTLNDIIRY